VLGSYDSRKLSNEKGDDFYPGLGWLEQLLLESLKKKSSFCFFPIEYYKYQMLKAYTIIVLSRRPRGAMYMVFNLWEGELARKITCCTDFSSDGCRVANRGLQSKQRPERGNTANNTLLKGMGTAMWGPEVWNAGGFRG